MYEIISQYTVMLGVFVSLEWYKLDKLSSKLKFSTNGMHNKDIALRKVDTYIK